jgi:uncharacterized protein YbjT (DUF2867 family)
MWWAATPPTRRRLASALHGFEAILLSPRTVGNATAELLSLAAKQGVQRVVVVSSAVTVVYPAGYRRFAEQFKTVEDTVKASGLRWTILRCADFASNALEWASQIRSAPDRLLSSLADYAKQPGPSTATVEQVLARPARTFAEWAADHAAASWN